MDLATRSLPCPAVTVLIKGAFSSFGLGKDTVYTIPVFSLWFNHGIKPKSESYEYIVVPGADENKLKNYTDELPITILSNTKEVQAISHNKLQLTGIVFYKAGSFKVGSDLTISVDQPALVLLDEQNKQISISDPTAKLKELNLTLYTNDERSWTKTIVLPAEGLAGKSVTLNID